MLLAGCTPAFLQLPAAAPNTRREVVSPRGGSCRGARCTARVLVGERPFVVTSRTRQVSPDEAAGRPRPPVLARAAGAAGNAILRRLGAVTTDLYVGLGTRTVSGPGSGPGSGPAADSAPAPRLACDVVWVAREFRERVSDSTQTTAARLASGLDCRVEAPASAPDSAPNSMPNAARWRIRRGIAPTGEALAAALDSLRAAGTWEADPGERTAGAPLVLARRAGADGTAERYTVTRDGPDPGQTAAPPRWLVRRPDGRVVGAFVYRVWQLAALDVADGASAEEAAVLRLLGACLAEPVE